MEELPLKLPTVDNPDEKVVVAEEDKEELNRALQNLQLMSSSIHTDLEKKELDQGMRATYCSLLESSTAILLSALGYSDQLEEERKARYGDIREVREQNRELRKQLGEKVSFEDCRERMKSITQTLREVCKIRKLGYVSSISFSETGILKFELSGYSGISMEGFDPSLECQTVEEDKFGSKGDILNTDANRNTLMKLVQAAFPSTDYIGTRSHCDNKGSDTIRKTEFYIRNLDDFATYENDDKHTVPDIAEMDAYTSDIEGDTVLHISTPGIEDNGAGPICRIVLNDDFEDPLWDNKIES